MGGHVSQVRSVLPCPRCGQGLFPASTDPLLTFLCKSGHETALEELLSAQSASVKVGLDVLLAEWERKQQALLTTVEDARKHGLLDVAEIFNRHAKSLESRIGRVRAAAAHSESSKLIALPQGLRPSECTG